MNEYGDDNSNQSDDSQGGSGGGSFGGRGRFGERKMSQATCSDCGQACEVPFEPSAGRPVYCRDCFQKHRKPRRY
ncbi:MAG: CxxC-x17-CxxC domain-containing protein [Candidatus Micrarchaeota archaeon]